MRLRCGITVEAPKGTILSIEATRILGLNNQAFRYSFRSREKRIYHRLDSGNHVHHFTYVPYQLFHFYALTLPYRRELINIPVQAIQEAELRNETEDILFIFWANERNAMVLRKELKAARIEHSALTAQITQLRKTRLDLQKLIIDSIRM